MFIGKAHLFIDGKSRWQIPPAFREGLLQGFYVTRGFEQNLLLLGANTFQKLTAQVASLNLADPTVRLLKRLLLAGAARLEADSAGHVSIPEELLSFAGLEKEAVLIGQGDYIEVWSPAAWEKQDLRLTHLENLGDRFTSLELTLA